jgi:signal peptidase II
MRHAVLFFAIALGGSGLDLLSKHLAFRHVPVGSEVTVIDGFFAIGHTVNKGVVFGKFGDAPTLWLVVSIAAVPAIIAIFFSGKKPRPWVQTISLGMILAGTVGNMADRIAFGAVRDFIKFYVRSADGAERVWPLFNLADSFICIGVFLLSVEMIFFEEKKSVSAKAAADGPAASPEGPAPASAPPPSGAP